MRIEYSKKAQKDLKRLPKDVARLVTKALEGVAENPPRGDIKTLNGFSDGRKRLRVGRYRVIFQYLDDGSVYVWVIEIGVRGDVYK